MKKAALFIVFALALATLDASAQTKSQSLPVFSIADSAAVTGKYKYEGLPFEYMEISVKDGKLYYSGGEYSGFLDPLMDKKDTFDAGNGMALFTFVRDDQNKVSELKIDYQGQRFLGKKEEKKS